MECRTAKSFPTPWSNWVGIQPAANPRDLLNRACPREGNKCAELLQSSFDSNLKATVKPSANGFVDGAIQAYSDHHHLQIRPEDIWFAIISQLSFYINRHAEELRELFVTHQGKKELVVNFPTGTRYMIDFGVFAEEMGRLVQENVVDPDLRQWVMPAFTTTTRQDKIIASILLMGVTQKYFAFGCIVRCGLPSVTLLGEKEDWELIDRRLDKLETLGVEPGQFCSLLRPILSHFVKSFDEPESEDTVNFWQRIAHYHWGGSGPSYYSGWITAFCFWNEDGKSLHEIPSRNGETLRLDDVAYHRVNSGKVPSGYSSVPVTVNDNGDLFDAMMVAGSVGINCTSGGEELADGIVGLDTISAETGWWMFERKSQAVLDEEKAEEDREQKKKIDDIMGRFEQIMAN
ncbi:hypothetical protein BDR22DRAFT_898512 [Usnea florida]